MDDFGKETSLRLEQQYVRSTYDDIAEDFSSTRYKKWPKVDEFLKSLDRNSIVLDVGCGNGKYLDNPSTFNIGCDASRGLLAVCKRKGFEVVQCDMTRLPFRYDIFDGMICIAALHHVVGDSRRRECLRSLSKCILPAHGKLLVQVWAFEQQITGDNPYLKKNSQYLTETVQIDESLDLKIHKNRTPFEDQDLLVPFNTKNSSSSNLEDAEAFKRHLRYYHLFKEKELNCLIDSTGELKLIDSYYDKGNWCSIIGKV